MTIIGAAGFYGYTLTNVLFLTLVWRYSALQAGLALTIGPVVAVAGEWLPGMVLLGIGAGTLFPNLTRRIDAGQWLFQEGEEADAMFIVRAGRLDVVDDAGGVVIRELGRGDAIGELGLLTGSPRSASVRAARTSDVSAVDRGDLDELLQSSPALSLALNRTLARQLRDTRAPAPATRPRPATVALVAFDARLPLPRLTQLLASALNAHDSVAMLDGAEVESPATGTEPATAYRPLLDRAEAACDVVLLTGATGPERAPWTEFCLQQADRILVVTRGGPVPEALAGRAELRGCDLVAYDAGPRRCRRLGGGAAPGRVTHDPRVPAYGGHGPRGPPAIRDVARDRALRRGCASVLAHWGA